MKIKNKSLMLGDWVKSRTGMNVKIVGISHDYPSVYESIPLTHEILEKNGWIFNDIPFVNGWEFMGMTICDWRISCGINISMKVRYVHELQHALRLCELNELADNFKV